MKSYSPSWPHRNGIITIEIQRYQEDYWVTNTPPRSIQKIEDREFIQTFFSLLESLPIYGEIYIDFSIPNEYLQIHCIYTDGHSEKIEFYNGHIKSPWTSFYSWEREQSLEKTLYNYILSLLS